MVSKIDHNLTTMRMLIERLKWPIRMVKWRTAKEFGKLMSSDDYSDQARTVFLQWLSGCSLESEVISGLVVLLCIQKDRLPCYQDIVECIPRPSILADVMLQFVYGVGILSGDWKNTHSGTVPDSYTPENYFNKHKCAHVPPILWHELQRIEKKTGLPFTRQWAFEWQNLMNSEKYPYSGYHYFFVNSLLNRSGINGQFSQRQCDVYRSAFLRTLACAVSCWGMPANYAAIMSLHSLPVNKGLIDINPIQRPDWLSDIPEQSCEPESSLENLTRQLIRPGLKTPQMRPVNLRIPISEKLYEFADLSIKAILATEDFSPDFTRNDNYARTQPWVLTDSMSFCGSIEREDYNSYVCSGNRGWCVPLCLNTFPFPCGFWHNDYFQVGISIPASYVFRDQIDISCQTDNIAVISDGNVVGSWWIWHDHWTPLYPKDGSTRCGTLTELKNADIIEAQKRYNLNLGWMVDLKIWKKKTDYGEHILHQRHEYFLD